MKNCDYIENSNEPCKDCPRVMSALHRCDVLLEIQKELLNEKVSNTEFNF